MYEWWVSFAGQWRWDSPANILGVLSILVTALIPVFLWRLGTKQASRDGELREQQVVILERQEHILQRQRRDSLLSIVDTSDDATHLALLWEELRDFDGQDRELLQATFRANLAVGLPGARAGVLIEDELNASAVAHYVAGLERRYGEFGGGGRSFDGLISFLSRVRAQGEEVEPSSITGLVTGAAASVQRPGHDFYRELVNVMPECAGGLLSGVEKIDYRTAGGIRLNVLTGVLVGIKDAELGRFAAGGVSVSAAQETLRLTVPSALAQLLHRDNLRSLDRWSLEDSTEPVSATVAWLVRAVGWFADIDAHLSMRMVQNLAPAIRSIPDRDRGWGIDDEDVRDGFEAIRQKRPELWEVHADELTAAASGVGEWDGPPGKGKTPAM